MTSIELARIAKAAKPHVRYAGTADDTSVVAWHDGRWIRVAGKLLNDRWASMEHELLVDGKPLPLPELIEV